MFVCSLPQIARMYEQKHFAEEIKAALDIVKSYQEANTRVQEEEEQNHIQFTSSKLKQKGHRPL